MFHGNFLEPVFRFGKAKVMLILLFEDFFGFIEGVLKKFLVISNPLVNFHTTVFFLDGVRDAFMELLEFFLKITRPHYETLSSR